MFPTLIAEVEANINNRPLITRASSDPNDLDALTLSELLYGRKLVLLPMEADKEDTTYGPMERHPTRLGENKGHPQCGELR